jgi:5-methylcytosine-specific restriction endonuclease McrA
MKKGHALLLAAAITDSTFERGELDGKRVWIGKCLHCNTRLVVGDDGRSLGAATLEHVFPQTQGGTDELANIAVACGRCNREKGSRHDHRGGERFEEVVALLRARRAERWRDPDAVGQAERLAALLAEDTGSRA